MQKVVSHCVMTGEMVISGFELWLYCHFYFESTKICCVGGFLLILVPRHVPQCSKLITKN